MAAVEGEHDGVVALGAKLLAHEPEVARGVLPVDRSVIEPGGVVAQGVELRPVPMPGLGQDAERRLAAGEQQRIHPNPSDVRYDGDAPVERYDAVPLDQAPGASPPHPEALQHGYSPSFRDQGNPANGGPRLVDEGGDRRRRRDGTARIEENLECGPRTACARFDRDRDLVCRAHLQGGRWRDLDPQPPSRDRQQGIDGGHHDRKADVPEAERPQGRIQQNDGQRERDSPGKDKRGSQGRSHQRGAGTWAMIASMTSSTVAPSISAPGERISR